MIIYQQWSARRWSSRKWGRNSGFMRATVVLHKCKVTFSSKPAVDLKFLPYYISWGIICRCFGSTKSPFSGETTLTWHHDPCSCSSHSKDQVHGWAHEDPQKGKTTFSQQSKQFHELAPFTFKPGLHTPSPFKAIYGWSNYLKWTTRLENEVKVIRQ